MSKASRRRSPGSRDERRATIAAKQAAPDDGSDLGVICSVCCSLVDFDWKIEPNGQAMPCHYCGVVDGESAWIFKSHRTPRHLRRYIAQRSLKKRKAMAE